MDKPTTLNIRFTVHNQKGGTNPIKLRHRIGLIYLPGALPSFEAFGNLPTDFIKADATLKGKPASETLDMIIIPGGSLVESQTLNSQITKEITKMADTDKLVLGICSGFQMLSNGTDIGRLSAQPIIRKGLGLIDAEFSPLVCTDQVKATVVAQSYLTEAVGAEVTGFHCHTYGKVTPHKNAKPILISHTKRLNYHNNTQDLVSGIANNKGNVVGVIMHALLDRNPLIIEGIQKSLDINEQELAEIRTQNKKLQAQIQSEIGIATNTHVTSQTKKKQAVKALLITALGSGSGKTFITTGLAGALKKRNFNVGVVKVGGDIRDIVAPLYLIKEPIRDYSSMKVGESGWKSPVEALKEISADYEFVIIEGAMSAFTGLLNEKAARPSSTAELAAALGVSTVVVVSCDKEGIEGALASTLNYVNLLKKLGVNVTGVILNKVRSSYLTDSIRQTLQQAFANIGVTLLGIVPRVDVEGRGAIPEIEIKYEDFCSKAIQTIEDSIDLDKVVKVATSPRPVQIDFGVFVEKFKKSMTNFCLELPEDQREKA